MMSHTQEHTQNIYTSITMANSDPGTTPHPVEDLNHQELPFIVGENTKWHRCVGRQLGNFFIKLSMLLLYDPVTIWVFTQKT